MGDNPFKKNYKKCIEELEKLINDFDATFPNRMLLINNGKSLEFEGYKVQELPKNYVEDYVEGDKAFAIYEYPVNDNWQGSIIEVHKLANGVFEFFLVL